MFLPCLPKHQLRGFDETKYGYRLGLERDCMLERPTTRGAHDQAPFGSQKITLPRFVLDSEDGVLGFSGVSDFNALPSRTIMK